MKRYVSWTAMLLAATIATAADAPRSSEVAELKVQVKKLQDENMQLKLKLQEEVERSDIQMFLTRGEITAMKREAAELRTKCGAACAQ
jgi:predicted RNase H-like nuclease (RuvC/YqgF family)